MKAIRLTSGELITADTYDAVESIILAGRTRDDIARDALNWSGVEMMTNGPAWDFLYEAERAGLCRVISDPTGVPAVIPAWEPVPRQVYLEAIRARAELKALNECR